MFLISNILPQEINFQQINSENGLNSNVIHQLINDDKGYLWISTRDGLSKYDGYNFTLYRNDVDDSSSILINDVSSICFYENTIWAATWGGGLNKMIDGNKFAKYLSDPEDKNSLSDSRIQKIFVDSDSTLWIATLSGLDQFIPAKNNFRRVLTGTHVMEITEDANKNLVVGTNNGIRIINKMTGAEKSLAQLDNFGITGVTDVMIDHSGAYWIGTDIGLYKFDIKTGNLSDLSEYALKGLNKQRVKCVFEDSHLQLWAGTIGGGLYLIDRENKNVQRFVNDINVLGSISNNVIYDIYEDKFGVLWISTLGGGLNKYDLKPSKFKLFRHNKENSNSLIHNSVYSFFEDKNGTIWLSTGKGLCRYDKKTGKFYSIDCIKDIPSETSPIISEISELPDGKFLFIVYDVGLFKFNPVNNCIEKLNPDIKIPQELEDRFPRGHIKTKDNEIIAGTRLGIYKINFQKGLYEPYKKFNGIEQLDGKSVQFLHQDEDGVFWYGTTIYGLFRVDYKNEEITTFSNNIRAKGKLTSDFILSLTEDKKSIWVGTYSGLNRIDKKTLEVKRFTEKDGLPSNFIRSVLVDNMNNLWISTNRGLSKYNLETNEFNTYDKADGLQENEFNVNCKLKTRDGELYFGGNNGFNSFYPKDIFLSKHVPPVYITKIEVLNNVKDFDKDVDEIKYLELDYKENLISFEFAALDFTNPRSNKYKYKLENFDQKWISSSDRRFASYTNLEPGEYVFKVIGSNSDQIWNTTGASIKIKIIPPYWQTAWFRVAAFLVTLFLIIIIYRLRVNSLEVYSKKLEHDVKKRTKELDESNHNLVLAKEKAEIASRAKSTFLAHMSHELRTPLNGMMGYAQILKNKTKNPEFLSNLEVMHQSGMHLLTLINDILDISKIEAGKMTLVEMPVNFQSFLENISGIISSRAVAKGLNFQSEFDPLLPNRVLTDETRLRQVLLNLLGNAVKFTDEGVVKFKVQKIEEVDFDMVKVSFEVTDSGSGIEEDELERLFKPFEQVGDLSKRKEGTGLGLSISRHIIELMGSDLKVDSVVGYGCNFWFDLELQTVSKDSQVVRPVDPLLVGYDGARRVILVADDIASNRSMIVKLLKPLDFEVYEASNGNEAIEKAIQYEPDLILMDRWMPDVNGLEAYSRIREIPELKGVPIVAVTVSLSQQDLEDTLNTGFNDVLSKPIIWLNLLDVLEKQLSINWVYEGDEKKNYYNLNDKNIIPLPSEEIDILYDFAKRGDIYAIQEYVKYVQITNEKYTIFINLLKKLADNFEEKKIILLLQRFTGINKE